MSDLGPFGSGGPFEDIMRNLAKLFNAPGPVNWEIARQFARWAATGGASEPNVDPLARVRIEELLRVAELHVAEATGFSTPGGAVLSARAVTRGEWALRTLEAWSPLIERLAGAVADSAPEALEALEAPDPSEARAGDPMAQLFGNIPQMLGPFLFGMQTGSMVGTLATRAMGQYDLPMPRPATSELLVIPATVDAFAGEWGLPVDDVRLWVCLREVIHHTVLGRPHVRARIDELIGDYVGAFNPDMSLIEERLSGLDPTDPASMQSAFADPTTLLGDLQNDTQRRLQVPLRALLSAVAGYTDHMMERVGGHLLDRYATLTEALHRRRLEDHGGLRALGQLFGVELDAEGYERGQAFVRGVLERAGEDGLGRLWRSAAELPTPAEVDAPGLWLARIDLDVPPTGDAPGAG